MPYQTVQSNYERVDGEVKMDGKIYKYVKRRIVNGELELFVYPTKTKCACRTLKTITSKPLTILLAITAAKNRITVRANIFKNITSDYEQQVNNLCLINSRY